jgi:transaldolase
LAKIALAGVDLERLTQQLEVDGVLKFEAAWLDLMKSVNAIASGAK